jgi:hypothetical protein
MREFTNPTYDGKKCVCCKPTIDNAANLLLDDNLVWDADFEAIRQDLGQLLIIIDRYTSTGAKRMLEPSLQNLVHKLTKGE